mgnify:CR=1 FL=1
MAQDPAEKIKKLIEQAEQKGFEVAELGAMEGADQLIAEMGKLRQRVQRGVISTSAAAQRQPELVRMQREVTRNLQREISSFAAQERTLSKALYLQRGQSLGGGMDPQTRELEARLGLAREGRGSREQRLHQVYGERKGISVATTARRQEDTQFVSDQRKAERKYQSQQKDRESRARKSEEAKVLVEEDLAKRRFESAKLAMDQHTKKKKEKEKLLGWEEQSRLDQESKDDAEAQKQRETKSKEAKKQEQARQVMLERDQAQKDAHWSKDDAEAQKRRDAAQKEQKRKDDAAKAVTDKQLGTVEEYEKRKKELQGMSGLGGARAEMAKLSAMAADPTAGGTIPIDQLTDEKRGIKRRVGRGVREAASGVRKELSLLGAQKTTIEKMRKAIEEEQVPQAMKDLKQKDVDVLASYIKGQVEVREKVLEDLKMGQGAVGEALDKATKKATGTGAKPKKAATSKLSKWQRGWAGFLDVDPLILARLESRGGPKGVETLVDANTARKLIKSPIKLILGMVDQEVQTSLGGKGKGGLLATYLLGKDFKNYIKGAAGDAAQLVQQGLSSFGFKNIGAGVGTFLGQRGQVGNLRAGGLGIGQGVLGFLAASYREAANVNTAMLGLSNITGRKASGALRYNLGGLGFDPMQTADLAGKYALATGDLGQNITQKGRRGRRFGGREGVVNMLLAERLGVGDSYAGLLGAAARTGTDFAGGGDALSGGGSMRVRGAAGPAQKVLADTIAVAIDQGLKRGRWREIFVGLAQVISSLPLGIQANMTSARDMTMLMGRAGFKGIQSTQAVGIMDSLMRGRGGEGSLGFGLLSAGLGGGKDYFEAYEKMEKGGIGGAGGMQNLKNYIATLRQTMGDERLMAHEISGMSGGKMSVAGARKIIQAAEGGASEADFEKRVQEITAKEKPLQEQAFEGMAQFGKFRSEQLAWQAQMYTLGMRISDNILELSKSFRQVVDIWAGKGSAWTKITESLTILAQAAQKLMGMTPTPPGGVTPLVPNIKGGVLPKDPKDSFWKDVPDTPGGPSHFDKRSWLFPPLKFDVKGPLRITPAPGAPLGTSAGPPPPPPTTFG